MKENRDKEKQRDAVGYYLLKLMRAALTGETLKEEPTDCSMEMVYELAKYNNVEGCVFYGLTQDNLSEELYTKWKSKCENTLFRQVSFDHERERIFEQMKAQGLSYLPLKGVHLAGYYPKPGMRAIADNDILYGVIEQEDGIFHIAGKTRKEQEEQIRKAQEQMIAIMKGLGYEIESLASHHDAFMKKPCFNFEMHRALMPASMGPLYDYYQNPWKWAVQDSNDPSLFSYPDEEEYIFFVAHTFKHFDQSGCGIRGIADEYVLLKTKQDHMDWTYIREHLEEMGLTEFEEQLRNLALHAIEGDDDLTRQDCEMFSYMLQSGTYGTIENYVQNRITKTRQQQAHGAKIGYIFQRIFLRPEEYREAYPFFYRHRWLRWMLPIYRGGRAVLLRPHRILRELIQVGKTK